MSDNILICGDNLEIMKKLYEEHGSFIDLIYIDPPFCSNRNYGIDKKGFEDKWEDGLTTYIPWLAERIQWMHKLLKDTGSIFVHLDCRAVHYVKVEMDKIFGYNNFQNEIVWVYATGGASKERFARKHDTILFYSKTSKYNFFPDRIMEDRTEKSLKRAQNPNGARIASSDTQKLPTDVWQIQALNPMAIERTGYPTQKPEELIKKIINGCSEIDDTIADFFSGSGTTISVAQKLGRRWIGVDQNPQAIEVTTKRLQQITKEK